jgi:hypothetical protein
MKGYYRSTFSGSAQIILFSNFPNFSKKKKKQTLNVENLKNSKLLVAKFDPRPFIPEL